MFNKIYKLKFATGLICSFIFMFTHESSNVFAGLATQTMPETPVRFKEFEKRSSTGKNGATSKDGEAVVSIDTTDGPITITWSELNDAVAKTLEMYPDKSNIDYDKLYRFVLERMIDMILAWTKGKKMKLHEEEKYKNIYADYKNSLSASLYVKYLMDTVKVSDEEIKTAYNDLQVPEGQVVKMTFAVFKSFDVAKTLIDTVKQKLQEAKKDKNIMQKLEVHVKDIVHKYIIDFGINDVDSMNLETSLSTLPPQIAPVVASMDIGDCCSSPIDMGNNMYAVMIVWSRDDPKKPPLVTMKDNLRDRIKNEKIAKDMEENKKNYKIVKEFDAQKLSTYDAKSIVVRVGNNNILYGELLDAINKVRNAGLNMPEEKMTEFALEQIIMQRILALESEKSGYTKKEEYKRDLESLTRRLLAQAYIASVNMPPSEEQLNQRYKEMKQPNKPQIKGLIAACKSDAAAKAIIKILDDIFKEMSGAISKAANKQVKDTLEKELLSKLIDGMKLGIKEYSVIGEEQSTISEWTSIGDMPPQIDNVISNMSGSYTKAAIKVNNHYVVILVQDKRDPVKPSFDDVKDILKKQWMEQEVQRTLNNLRKEFKITYNFNTNSKTTYAKVG